MKKIFWRNLNDALPDYWKNMIAFGYFRTSQIAEDLRNAILEPTMKGLSLTDMFGLNGRLGRLIECDCLYSSVVKTDNLVNTLSELPRTDFILSGPTGPWRIRDELMIADDESIDSVALTIDLATSKSDLLLIWKDRPPQERLEVKGPGNSTLMSNMCAKREERKQGNVPQAEAYQLLIKSDKDEEKSSVIVTQYLFLLDDVLKRTGAKICWETELFWILGKKRPTCTPNYWPVLQRWKT